MCAGAGKQNTASKQSSFDQLQDKKGVSMETPETPLDLPLLWYRIVIIFHQCTPWSYVVVDFMGDLLE